MAQRTTSPEASQADQSSGESLPVIVRYWIHRLMLDMNGLTDFIGPQGFCREEDAIALGLGEFISDDMDVDFDHKKVRKHLINTYRTLKKQNLAIPDVLAQNSQSLAELVGLTPVERRIFEFVVLLHTYPVLKGMCVRPRHLKNKQLTERLATLLELDRHEVWQALRPSATLARSGLVTIGAHSYHGSLDDFLEVISESLAEKLTEVALEPSEWLRDMVRLGEPSHLQWNDYKHLDKAISVLRPYLRHALEQGKQGVNIFLYGPPGTGKTQLARLLAQDMGVDLFEVATEDADNDPIGGRKRVKAQCAANCFFAQSQAVILFDEVEEVFGDSDSPRGFAKLLGLEHEVTHSRKGWLNRVLETNKLPTIWVANSLYGLDAAFVRRFDMVLEMPVPPRSHREQIIRDAGGDMLTTKAVASLAQSEKLTPAVVAKAVSVVQAVQTELTTPPSDAVHLLVNNTLEAQGHRPVRTDRADDLPNCYDPAFINADTDLTEVTRMLQTARTGRLCLYGPPGTGKTAFGRWLADQLKVPLHVRRASDLLGMYVGESEKNIARAFAEAQADQGVLLIDEVDSFLQNRQGAQRSWEVSQVNEMLTQMESFSGVFIASTNLMDQLDPAVMRRFDLKVRFNALQATQAVELLKRYGQEQGLPDPSEQDVRQLQALHSLTPGDFAAVKRQSRLRPISSTAQWVKALQAECDLKPRAQRSGMGFV